MPGIQTILRTAWCIILVACLFGCSDVGNEEIIKDEPIVQAGRTDSALVSNPPHNEETHDKKKDTPGHFVQKPGVAVPHEEIMQFAETLIGVPYRYASSDPAVGFDCSGFITYVFDHFGIIVPRTSIGFTDLGLAILEESATRGDVILFTGTNPDETMVGHMGLITSHDDSGIHFIHSTSGKANAVTITELNDYYRERLVGFRRIL